MISKAKIITHKYEKFVYGELVKYKRMLEGEVVNEDTKQRDLGGLPFGVVSVTKFFIHFDSQVIAYRPISSRVSEKQFRLFLSKLIEKGHNNFFVSADIESVDEDIEITKSISLLKRVSRIFLDVKPTNPSNRPVYEKLDNRLKRLEAKKEQRTLISTEQGFNLEALKDDEVYMGIVLAADGYGRASVHGEKEDGTKVVIRTSDSPVIKSVSDSEEPLAILVQLFKTFERIWKRTRNAK
jgi:hypothetical protein